MSIRKRNRTFFLNPLIPFLPTHSSGETKKDSCWKRDGAANRPKGMPSALNRSSFLTTSHTITLTEATIKSS